MGGGSTGAAPTHPLPELRAELVTEPAGLRPRALVLDERVLALPVPHDVGGTVAVRNVATDHVAARGRAAERLAVFLAKWAVNPKPGEPFTPNPLKRGPLTGPPPPA